MSRRAEVEDSLKSVLTARPEVRLAILYGSAAEGRLRAESDVDVAVAGKGLLGIEKRLAIYEAVEKRVKRPVDVADLRQAGDFFLGQIFKSGKILLCRDQELLVALAKRAIYFNEDMAPLRDRLIRRQAERFARG